MTQFTRVTVICFEPSSKKKVAQEDGARVALLCTVPDRTSRGANDVHVKPELVQGGCRRL